jgi:PAS domain S-box-containing protein
VAAQHDDRFVQELVDSLRQSLPLAAQETHLSEAFHRLLRQIMRAIECDAAHIVIVKMGQAWVVAHADQHDSAGVSPMVALPVGLDAVSAFAWMSDTCEPLLVPDTRTQPQWVDPPLMQGVRSYLGAPLHTEDHLIGFINLSAEQPNAFCRDHVETLSVFAELATTLVQNAVLTKRAERRLADMQAMVQIMAALSAGDPLPTALNGAAERLRAWLSASAVIIYLREEQAVDPSAHPLVLQACAWSSPNAEDEPPDNFPCADVSSVMGAAVATRSASYVDDLSLQPDYHPLDPNAQCAILAPLLVGEQIIGLIVLEYSDAFVFFDAETPASIITLSTALASAIDSARLLHELQESEARFRQLTDSIQEVFWLIDPYRQEVVFASAAFERMWGRSLDSLYEDPSLQAWLQTVHEDDREQLVEQMRRAAQHRTRPNTYDYRIVRPDGEIRSIRMASYPVRNDQGVIYRLAIVTEDVTDRLRAESQARELELEKERVRLLNEFVSDASHDLKTPLTAMMLNLQIVRRKHPELNIRQIEVLTEETERLTRLVEDLLTMSRLDAGRGLRTPQPYDLNQVIEGIIEDNRKLSARRAHVVAVELRADLPLLLGDSFEIGRAVTNLFINALNYTPNGGRVEIVTDREGGDALIEIRDNGIGIDAEDLPHIFDRFFRSGRARQTNKGGTGLGLAIVKKIVGNHGGTVEVESEVDIGSVFRVRLPLPRM